MARNRQTLLAARLAHRHYAPLSREAAFRKTFSKRARGEANQKLPFVPPEDWHEPQESCQGYRLIVQQPGRGYRHVVTPEEVRERLSRLPERFLRPLQVVQLSRVTRKKKSYPCYGMQWGAALYLYPIEEDLVEHYYQPPKPAQLNEARMYGGRWVQEGNVWKLVWTEAAIKDFYLNNILIHELGHLLDERNSRTIDRERFAEWFAIRYGYLPTRHLRHSSRPARRRALKR